MMVVHVLVYMLIVIIMYCMLLGVVFSLFLHSNAVCEYTMYIQCTCTCTKLMYCNTYV